ncbi:LysR family transcriptional regulator [Alicycliphilus denitrificans]|uniref:LysR family transcriptional regulator n=1 Tax=Alicycliphilus denitrificans TaxID=179636 RepID=A0A858ZYI8_9BURK|nr:LysR family transcriptional regulator [Alicycliphilus denitrificans]QKD45737.1 LysR family transcriptional regulator [Alicycliphilus denitrificans]
MSALHLTLRQLQIFVAVARKGSTAAAGADIGLSQSATSAALNELERLLSMQLFDRAGKRLILNNNGRELLPRALALLDSAMQIERLADEHSGAPPSLRIGASTTIGNYVLPIILGQYLAGWYASKSSTWHAQMRIGNTAEICAGVASFELDIGLIEGPCHEPELEAKPWLCDQLVVVASPRVGEQLTRLPSLQSPLPINALREQVWLLREAGSGTRVATDQELLPHLRSYHRSIEMGSSEAIKHAAAEGLGLACLSEWVVADLIGSKRLVRLETALPTMIRQCYLVTHRQKQTTAALGRLVAYLMEGTTSMAATPVLVSRVRSSLN